MKNKLLILAIVIFGSVNSFAGWAKYRDRIIDAVKETVRNNRGNNYYEDNDYYEDNNYYEDDDNYEDNDYYEDDDNYEDSYDSDDYYYDNGNYYQNPDEWNYGNCRFGC